MKAAVSLICLLGVMAAVLPASAKKIWPAQGGSGDISNAIECEKKDEYMVGIFGRAGAWIDRIGPICAPVLPSGAMGHHSHSGGLGHGGSGGGPASAECSSGLIRGITYRLTGDHRMVLTVHFTCWDAKTQALIQPLQNHDFGGNGSRVAPAIENPCPDGEAARGLETRWGKHVNAIGLRCDSLKVPK
jgi:hypothetical protein